MKTEPEPLQEMDMDDPNTWTPRPHEEAGSPHKTMTHTSMVQTIAMAIVIAIVRATGLQDTMTGAEVEATVGGEADRPTLAVHLAKRS